jgi:hypothetical protein
MFTTVHKLLLLRKMCETHAVPDDLRETICEYIFITPNDVMNRVRELYIDVVDIIDSASSRKNGFGGLDMHDTEDEHWMFEYVECVRDEFGTTFAGIYSFEGWNCGTCGNYIPCPFVTGQRDMPRNIVCVVCSRYDEV